MHTTTDISITQLVNLEPEELLRRFATFKHYQLLGEALGYNPQITAMGNVLPLKDWDYDQMDSPCQAVLNRWTKSKQAAPEIVRQLLNAAKPTWGEARTYVEVLKEIAQHLDVGILTGKTLADFEQVIVQQLLKQALSKLDKLPASQKAKVNEELDSYLKKQGVERGGESPLNYLKAGGFAGAGALVGTHVVTGIILSHLGFYHAVLFALGLWSVPTLLIGGGIFAPLMAGWLAYQWGQHNFKKTIPCVGIIGSLRQEALFRTSSSGS
jgi:hypothetical protein